ISSAKNFSEGGHMLHAECRNRLKVQDFEFIIHVLKNSEEDTLTLEDLLKDENTRDLLLDHDLIYHSMLERCDCIRISSAFFFYVLTRRMLKNIGLDNRRVADYIASLLELFSRQGSKPKTMSDPSMTYHRPYISEMMEMLDHAAPDESFLIHAHIADYALFLSGVFPVRVQANSERHGSPGLSFYEGVGRSNYHCASSHRLAKDSDLSCVMKSLSESFHEVRCALNQLSEEVLHFESQNNEKLIALEA
ncbi:MAG: hypothetical protein AAF984_03210, partial [Verrucomicrobiota bacterium]